MAEQPTLRFTAAQLHAEALREVAMRERVYADRVSRGKMTRQDATRRTEMMRQIAAIVAEKAAGERLL